MQLSEIIKEYNLEEYEWSAFSFEDDIRQENQTFKFKNHKDYFEQYLGYYRKLDNFEEVILNATLSYFELIKEGEKIRIRHSHQAVYIDYKGNQIGVKIEIAM